MGIPFVLQSNMTEIDMKDFTDDNLQKKILDLKEVDDWNDKCGCCGKPAIFHDERYMKSSDTLS